MRFVVYVAVYMNMHVYVYDIVHVFVYVYVHLYVYANLNVDCDCSTLFKDAATDEFGLVDCDIEASADVSAAAKYEDDFM